jgi:hypothetical protein
MDWKCIFIILPVIPKINNKLASGGFIIIFMWHLRFKKKKLAFKGFLNFLFVLAH